MPKFYIQLTEKYGHTMIVEAEDALAAEEKAQDALCDGEIEITEADYWDDSTDIDVCEYDKYYADEPTLEELIAEHTAEYEKNHAKLVKIETLLNDSQSALDKIANLWKFEWDENNQTDFDVDTCNESDIDAIGHELDVIEGVVLTCKALGYSAVKNTAGKWHVSKAA